jgi:predicted aspartyl protease
LHSFFTLIKIHRIGRETVKNGSKRFWAIAGVAVTSLTSIGLAVGWQSPVKADDPCYMITSSGRRVSLGKLCGMNKTSQPAQGGIISAKIKRRSGGTPVIDVTFNGSQTFEMLLDTGASGTLITRSMAKALKLPIVGVDQFTMADGRTVLMPLGRLQSMAIQNASVKNLNVAIAPDSADGLLGHDFLGNYDIKIKQNEVEFYPR